MLGGGFLSPATCQVEDGGDLVRWADSLPMDSRVLRELQRFSAEEEFSQESVSGFIGEVRSRIISAVGAQTAKLLAGECRPSIEVSIGDSDFSTLGEAASGESWEDFQKSLIRTEMVACLETDRIDPEAVLQTYVSPEFRMRAESRITDMWIDSVGSCMETKGAYGLVDPTRVCNRVHDFSSEDMAAQHSQVVFNEGIEPYQDAYFKESLKTFVRVPGGMALHYINFTRAADLGRIERWIGAGKIKDSQNATLEELQRWLRESGDCRLGPRVWMDSLEDAFSRLTAPNSQSRYTQAPDRYGVAPGIGKRRSPPSLHPQRPHSSSQSARK